VVVWAVEAVVAVTAVVTGATVDAVVGDGEMAVEEVVRYR
jgi:hypothetical protein